MRILVLSWEATAHDGGLHPQARGLAAALARNGHTVRLVTRLGTDGVVPEAPGVEVHAVTDAPPIVPAELDDPVLGGLAFAARATSVAVRRLEEEPADVVHAEGWQAGPVVSALRTSHDVRVVAALGRADLDGHGAGCDVAEALAADADLVVTRSSAARDRWATSGVAPRLLSPGCEPPRRTPGPPPASGRVLLVPPDADTDTAFVRAVRGDLATPRTLSRSWRRRPAVVAALDPDAVEPVLRGLAAGVPLLAVDGPAGELVRFTGAGDVIEPDPAAVARELDRLADDPERAAALGRAASVAAQQHAWPVVAAAWEELVGPLVGDATAPRLRAAD